MNDFNSLAEKTHQDFEKRNTVRDKALGQARQLTRFAAHAIRAIHRSEIDQAQSILAEACTLVAAIREDLAGFPDLFFAGYTQDALKEYAEANITCALIQGKALPLPEDLELSYSTYMNGLAETTGELRRRCLDLLRKGYSPEAERLLGLMDEIYSMLVTLDYPDAITDGLRRHTDLVRGIVERTRADLTLSQREELLQQALQKVADRLPPEKP
jgi:translin